MTISEKDVRHVAGLARLRVEEQEIEPLVRHFEAILGHFAALSKAREEGQQLQGNEQERADGEDAPRAGCRPALMPRLRRRG